MTPLPLRTEAEVSESTIPSDWACLRIELSLFETWILLPTSSALISFNLGEALSLITPRLSIILSIDSRTYGYVLTELHFDRRTGYFTTSLFLKKPSMDLTVSSERFRSNTSDTSGKVPSILILFRHSEIL